MSILYPVSLSWGYFPKVLRKTIQDNFYKDLLEIGAGPNPVLSSKLIEENKLNYIISDIDPEELRKGKHSFNRQTIDFAAKDFRPNITYDLIFSKMVLEHIQDPETFHQNIFRSLKPGGIAIHFFATLYGLPSLANLLLPEWMSQRILFYFQKRNPETEGKFPAYYHWCFGPVKRNIQRFEEVGFEVVQYNGYLGHTYLKEHKLLWPLEKMYNRFLLGLNQPYLTSNAIIILRKNV